MVIRGVKVGKLIGVNDRSKITEMPMKYGFIGGSGGRDRTGDLRIMIPPL
jgi:hypothetical protein